MAPAIASAVLFGACFPSTPFSLIAFVALSPFFICLSKTNNFREAFFRGFVFGGLYSLVIAYWVFNALYFHYEVNIIVSLLFLLGVVALPVALLLGFFAISYRFLFRSTICFAAFVVPSLWVLCDFLRDLVPLFLPWGFAGYSLASFSRLIQIADIAGVHGVTFCVVAVNALVAHGWLKYSDIIEQNIRKRLFRCIADGKAIVAGALAIPLALSVYGAVRMHQLQGNGSDVSRQETITAKVVQGSFALRERWESNNVMELLERSLRLTGRLNHQGRFFIVWPETVLNAGGSLRDAIIAKIISVLGEGNLLVFGGARQERNGETYNSAYFLSGRGAVKVYDKIILLPFAETTPWGISIFGNFYEAPARFAKGLLPQVVALDGIAVGFSICFEKIYPWFVRREVVRGAKILVNISNDSWFGRSTNPYQSLDIAVFRAVENRRWMIVSSNSGISAIIAPWGTYMARSGLFTEEVIEAEVMLRDGLSIYTKCGDIILFAAIIIIGIALWRILDARSVKN